MTSLFPRLPMRTGLLLLAVLAGLVLVVHSVAVAPLKAAITCQEDWEAIVATIETGGTSYEGTCAFYGNPEGSAEVPPPIREELGRAETEVQALAGAWTGTQTASTAVAVAGGLPLVVVMVVFGVVTVASEVKAGTAAWMLSNGWTRRRYLVEKWISLAVASAVVLLFAVALEAVLIVRDVDGRVGLEASPWGWGMVGAGAVAMLGAWIYASVGMLIGLGLGSPDSGILVSALVVGVDALAVAPMTGSVLSPASALAVILRHGDPAIPASWVPLPHQVTWTTGLAWAAGWGIVITAAVAVVLVVRRFQARPARPA